MLEIKKQQEGTTLNVLLAGRIDSGSVDAFNREVRDSLDGFDRVIIDMKDLTNLTSAGLRTLLPICKEMRKRNGMVLRNVRPNILEIFEFTGFDTIFDME